MEGTFSGSYARAGAMLVLSVALAWLAIAAGRRAGPQPRPPEDNPPYERGSRSGHETRVMFRVRYALIALIYMAFEMEMIYMFPWGVAFLKKGFVAYLDFSVFLAILGVAIVYAWKEGALDWER
jgi:NADH:ubiquinone oxidoreductase subunit 3 (subunit A)